MNNMKYTPQNTQLGKFANYYFFRVFIASKNTTKVNKSYLIQILKGK